MEKIRYEKTKYACFFTYLATSSIFSLPPLLFATFKEMYGISYTLLGTLVLVNFCTQLGIDLIFSFFSKYFNMHKTICIMPLGISLGLCMYALIPTLFPQYAYVGLLLGTFIFSVSAGLGEVLLSPTVSACSTDTPEKDMSMLHSLYGYGVVSVVLISTLFFKFVGNEYWMYLTFFWATLPVIASIMFFTSPFPNMHIEESHAKAVHSKQRTKGLILCVMCIFLGACAENTMTNWISVYAETVLNIPKAWGDIFGMSLFAVLLALTRTVYAKFGRNIFKALLCGMSGSVVCYIVVAISPFPVISLISCVALGICTAMLWPGTLILMDEKIPVAGVAAYALMAAGGDFGASIAPQTLGILVDNIALTEWAKAFGSTVSLTPEQVGFKIGMLMISIFPILGVILLLYMKKFFQKQNER